MSDINYNENIYDAISTIIDSRLTQLKNDLTIVATVLLQDKDNPLKYLLSNANMKFWAYSDMENKTYTNNSSVYVLVPNGDYTQKKLILSEVPIETNKKTYGITNRFNLFIKTVAINPCSFLNADTTPTPFGPLYYNTNYNAIGYTLVPADNYNLSSTDMFSIEINFNLRNIDEQGIEQLEPLLDKPIVITNRDLRGNPYSLSKAITYDFVYSCPESLLRHLTDNLIITYKVINGIESIADFDFELYGWLGYTIDYPLINTNELKIYSNKDTDYNNWSTVSKLALEDYEQTLLEIASNSELTEKQKSQAKKQALSQLTIKLKQANAPTERIEYTDNNEDIQIYLEAFGDKDSNVIASPYPPSNNFSTIAVYRYRVGSVVDKKLGPNWEMIGIYQKDILSFVYKNSDWIQLGRVDLGAGKVFFTDFETTKIKIICNVLNGDKTLEFVSPTLTYYNANKDVTTKTQDTGDLKLSLGDGDNGIYNIYGLDNHIKKQKKNSYMVRVTTNTGENLMSEDGKTYNSDFGINKIEWIYPTNLTGIVPIEERDATGKVTGKLKGLLDDSGRWGDVFYYTLKDKCYPTYTNNTIRCLVYYNGVPQPKEASITLDFGGFGNRNTPYSLNIDIVGNEKFLRLDNKILLIASLERTDGEAVKLPLTNWTWGFVSENTPCNFVTADGANLNNGDGKSFTTITGTEEIWLQGPGVDSLDTYNTVVKLTVPKVQVNDVSQQDLVAYLPIPLMCATNETAAANTYSYLGPDRVVYDGLNDNSYDESVIGLYINGENVVIGGLSIIDNEDVARGVYSSKALNLEDFNKQYSSSAHILAYTSSNEEQQTYNSVKLLAVPGTLINQKPFVNTIVIKDESLNDIWKLPIITFRNLWESLIYNWSGNGVLQDGNAIYSPYIAAGKKENDNTFTGIMLGGVDGFFSPSDKIYGLFGTSKGSPRFYLTEDAEFYIGNSNGSKPYGITLDRNGYLEVKLNLFYLDVPHLKIDSDNKRIDIYSDSDNITPRARYGLIRDNVYGLDIYEGAIRIYTKEDEEYPTLWVSDGNVFLRGRITNIKTTSSPFTWMTMGIDESDGGSGFRIYNTNIYNSTTPIFKIWPGYKNKEYDTMIISGYKKIKLSPYVTPNNTEKNSYSSYLEVNTSGGGMSEKWVLYNTHRFSGDIKTKNSLIICRSDEDYNTYDLHLWADGSKSGIIDAPSGNLSLRSKNLSVITGTTTGGTLHGAWNISTINVSNGGTLSGAWSIDTIHVGNGEKRPIFRVDITDVAYLSWKDSTYLGLTIDSGTGFAILRDNGNGSVSYKFATNTTGGHLYGTWTPSNWTSDVRLKHSIENLNDYYEILFNNLLPKRYKYNNGTSDRYHTGFIAQEVLTAVESAGLTTQDFAAMYLTDREDSGLDEPIWVLRRDEFVALNTWQIQKLKARVTELENEIKELKQNEIYK